MKSKQEFHGAVVRFEDALASYRDFSSPRNLSLNASMQIRGRGADTYQSVESVKRGMLNARVECPYAKVVPLGEAGLVQGSPVLIAVEL